MLSCAEGHDPALGEDRFGAVDPRGATLGAENPDWPVRRQGGARREQPPRSNHCQHNRALPFFIRTLPRNAAREPSSLVPKFDGASSLQQWKDALWVRFFMGAPARQRQSVEQYKMVKRA